MKTVFLLCFLALGLAACNKNKQYCWECGLALPGSSVGTVDTVIAICNATKESIKELEAGGAYQCKKK